MSTEPTESSRFLGRYELVHPLGQGGMGEVFLAKISGAAGFEKPCIVKTILPALLKDRQFLDRFHHEAKVLVHLVHSSIAQVYDMGETDGTYYMALEYVAGVDLAYLLEQARVQGAQVPVPVALFLGQRMAEGLGYAHRKVGPDGVPLGIVHRDVSPHNVMVSYEGEVKVIDFGLAKSAARSKYTLPATVMGKLGYMSPEQVRAEALDHRSDIYSCGVVLWEMLAGRSLIPHGTVGEMMAAMSHPTVPPLTGLRGDVDEALDTVVRRALATKPDERYSRSDELARALNGELVRSGAAVGAEEVGHFVRALCPEAFAAQRQLISKVTSSSSHRRTPAPIPLVAGGTGAFGTGPQEVEPAGFEPTLMRKQDTPSGEKQVAGMARPGVSGHGESMATDATTLRSGSDPGAATARTAVFDGATGSTPRPSAPDASASGPRAEKPSGSGPRFSGNTSVLPSQAESPSGSGPRAAAPEDQAPVRPVSSSREQVPARRDEGRGRKGLVALVVGLVVLLMVGTAVTTAHFMRPQGPPPVDAPPPPPPGHPPPGGLAGMDGRPPPPGQPPPRDPPPVTPPVIKETPPPVTAQAPTQPEPTPVIKKPTPKPDKVVTAPPKRPNTPPKPAPEPDKAPVEPVVAANTGAYGYFTEVVALTADDGTFLVKGARSRAFQVGMDVKVVGEAASNGQRPVFGSARVIATERRQARLKLAKDVKSAPKLYAAVPAEDPYFGEPTERGVEPASATTAPPKTGALTGHVAKRDPLIGTTVYTVSNADEFEWTDCVLVIETRQRATLGELAAYSKREVSRFSKPQTQLIPPAGKAGVYCKEGTLFSKVK
ncbi:protein kinase [Myxococcus sp. K38C18041901]|uniref:serine/threonine protein kinase n=1 Tax=Myxococcus guangdongensis TaxID=2906760 RepID=UPI0020A7E72B|nr:serine/threonine protein kinase [Myxococcus guangdongensis]MCP3062729.1 protein kinase [Myxococcus guangdongensis]